VDAPGKLAPSALGSRNCILPLPAHNQVSGLRIVTDSGRKTNFQPVSFHLPDFYPETPPYSTGVLPLRFRKNPPVFWPSMRNLTHACGGASG